MIIRTSKSYCTNSNSKKWNRIMRDYQEDITLCFTDEEVPFCIYGIKNIYFKYEIYKNPTENDLFDLLHEIGHIMTNNTKMKRCEEEFYATQWALDNSKKYGVKVSRDRLSEFQNYIWKWRETGIKLKAKNIPTKQQLKLIY